jgi:hypothetical protein
MALLAHHKPLLEAASLVVKNTYKREFLSWFYDREIEVITHLRDSIWNAYNELLEKEPAAAPECELYK